MKAVDGREFNNVPRLHEYSGPIGKIEPNDLHDLLNVIRDENEPSPGFDVVLIGMNPDPLELRPIPRLVRHGGWKPQDHGARRSMK